MESDPINRLGGWNVYEYAQGNPFKFIDPTGLDSLTVTYWGYPITVPGTNQKVPLVHGGIVAIDPSSGHTQYFEYGRYGSDFGSVNMSRRIPDLVIQNGMPTTDSLNQLKAALSGFGEGSTPSFSYDEAADYDSVVAFAQGRAHDKNRAPYSWNPFNTNDCMTFMNDAHDAGVLPNDPAMSLPPRKPRY